MHSKAQAGLAKGKTIGYQWVNIQQIKRATPCTGTLNFLLLSRRWNCRVSYSVHWISFLVWINTNWKQSCNLLWSKGQRSKRHCNLLWTASLVQLYTVFILLLDAGTSVNFCQFLEDKSTVHLPLFKASSSFRGYVTVVLRGCVSRPLEGIRIRTEGWALHRVLITSTGIFHTAFYLLLSFGNFVRGCYE